MNESGMTRLPLKEIRVAVSDLYLWPDNPRLRAVCDDNLQSPEDIAEDRVQARLLEEMSRPEFETNELMDSIRARGFVTVDSVFVKRIDSTEKYLVIEGNRRTTALKRLLNRADELPDELVNEIRVIPAKEIVCRDLDEAKDNIDFILGLRHHGGIKIWGPIQRAHNLYQRYLVVSRARRDEFIYDVRTARTVGASFTVSTKAVRKSLRVFRVFEQLRLNSYPVRNDHFSLIDAGITNRILGESYFEQDRENFQLSSLGMERFERLCLVPGCSITNPKHFSAFAKVVAEGMPGEVRLIEAGGTDPNEVWRKIRHRLSVDGFREMLGEIRDGLERLPISEFRSTAEEVSEIKKIRALVEERLVRIVARTE